MHPTDPWRIHLFVGACACIAAVAFRLKDKPLALLWAYALGSAAATALAPWTRFEGDMGVLLDISTAQAFAFLLLFPLPLLIWGNKLGQHWRKLLTCAGLAECLLFWSGEYSLFINKAPAMGAAFVACLVPVAVTRSWLISSLFFLMVVAARGSTGYLILGAQLLTSVWTARSKRMRITYGLCILLILAAGVVTQGTGLFQEASRLPMWKAAVAWWNLHGNLWFGTGAGTFFWLGPKMAEFQPPLWFFLHNDWLQILFELGIIGLALSFGVFLQTLKRAGSLAPVVMGGAAYMLTFSPWHFFWSALLFIALLWEINE